MNKSIMRTLLSQWVKISMNVPRNGGMAMVDISQWHKAIKVIEVPFSTFSDKQNDHYLLPERERVK